MAFEIGNKAHNIFPLADEPGRIRGITTLPEVGRRIDVEELMQFEFLAQGETVSLDDACAVEVVDFHAESYRGRESHFMRVRRVGVATGAELTGPIAWRRNGAMEPPIMPKLRVPRILPLAAALACLWPIGSALYEAYLVGLTEANLEKINNDGLWWLMGTILFLGLGIANMNWQSLHKALEKDPVLEVLTPARRLWA